MKSDAGGFVFERLEVWHRAVVFANEVYSLTRGFPPDERFGLTSQLRRAAVSVASNIAEGAARGSRREFVRFIEIATGSLYEAITQSIIALNQGFLSQEAFDKVYSSAQEQSRMLSGLRRSLLREE